MINLQCFMSSQLHFNEGQFEHHRVDKKRKLKPNAIPTVFAYKLKEGRVRKSPRNRRPIVTASPKKVCQDHTYATDANAMLTNDQASSTESEYFFQVIIIWQTENYCRGGFVHFFPQSATFEGYTI